MAGVRTAAVQVVATATLAALIAGGGLGRFIIDGLAVQDKVQLFAGAVMVAALSALTEVSLSVIQRLVTPAGLGDQRPASVVPMRPGGGMF
jgi:osmoprotectant transport system permease protein